MRPRILCTTLVALTLCSFALEAQPKPSMDGCPEQIQATPASATSVFVTEDGQRKLMRVEPRMAIEQLTGHRAIEHLKRRRAEEPDRFRSMGTALAERGYEPTNQVVVYRTVRLVGDVSPGNWHESVAEPSDVRFAADTASSDEGEVIFWSWDDGDDGTWEGATSVERYSDGAYANYDGQTGIDIEDYYEIWTEQTSSGGGGGCSDPDCDDDLKLMSTRTSGHVVPALIQPDGRHGYRLAQSGWDWGAFLGCSLSSCAFQAGKCLFTGPAWSGCFTYHCSVHIVKCAIVDLIGVI